MTIEAVFNLPFEEQIAFFRKKLNVSTERWDDLWHGQHAKGFMVAGAMKADLLDDFRQAVDKAVAGGVTLAGFREDFDRIVEKHGWSYRGGRNWRSRVIYDTNVRQAYNAGRYVQMEDPDVKRFYGYQVYRHGDSRVPRPHHLAWDGITLPADDLWWKTHKPQNGWGCRCKVFAATRDEFEAARARGKGEAPPSPIDPETGEPIGIDKGFGFNIGQAYLEESHDILAGKLVQWPADIGAAAMSEMAAPARKIIETNYGTFIEKALSAGKAERAYALLGSMTRTELEFLEREGKMPQSAGIAISDRIIVGKKAARHEAAGNALTDNEWRNLPAGVLGAEAVLYDRTDGKLLFVSPSMSDPRKIKVVVESDVYVSKLKKRINEAAAVFKVDVVILRDRTKYELVRGEI